jgi:predicted ester cyclase
MSAIVPPGRSDDRYGDDVDSPLRQRYLDYLEVLNGRRFEDLVDVVGEDLTYNGSPMTREQYQDARRRDVAMIPDLRFEVDLLVVEGDQVAAILRFDCTPEKPFLGFQPTGQRIQFTEHVFYRFSDGLITEVRSLIDREAVREQLT